MNKVVVVLIVIAVIVGYIKLLTNPKNSEMDTKVLVIVGGMIALVALIHYA
jgi:hypothetical protein